MSADLRAHVEARLTALRQFLRAYPFAPTAALLVRYRGVDLIASLDLAMDGVETQVAGSLADGLRVDWICRNERLYLRVCESEGTPPSWERVFAQRDLADAWAMLDEPGPRQPG